MTKTTGNKKMVGGKIIVGLAVAALSAGARWAWVKVRAYWKQKPAEPTEETDVVD